MKTRFLTAILFAAAAFVMVSQFGCTPTRSAVDNSHRQARLFELEAKMLVEDVNHFLLLEHPTRLSTWHYKR